MSGVAKAAGKGLEITLKGEVYRITPLTINDLAEFEAFVKSQRLKVFLNATKGDDGLTSKERIDTITKIASQEFTDTDIGEHMATITGTRFLMWRALSKEQPKLKLEDMGTLIDMNNFKEIADLLNAVSGREEESKNGEGAKGSK